MGGWYCLFIIFFSFSYSFVYVLTMTVLLIDLCNCYSYCCFIFVKISFASKIEWKSQKNHIFNKYKSFSLYFSQNIKVDIQINELHKKMCIITRLNKCAKDVIVRFCIFWIVYPKEKMTQESVLEWHKHSQKHIFWSRKNLWVRSKTDESTYIF